ncbi:metallopeptidase TldD-related protein [Streptomyces sp. NPDC054834]
MRQLEARTGEALAVADAVEASLLPGERSFAHIARSARRTLGTDPSGTRRLSIQQGKLDGYVLLARHSREVYVYAPDAAADEAAWIVEAARAQLPLGRSCPPAASSTLHDPAPAADDRSDAHTPVGLELLAADPGPLLAHLTEGIGPGCALRGLTVSEVLSESVHAESAGTRGVSSFRGVEVHAVAAATAGTAVASLSRYAVTLDRLDPAALGRELALTVAAFGAAAESFSGQEVCFTPSAAAQLLRAVVATLLINPLTDCAELCTAIIDDGRTADGCAARAFDCEGTPTGAMELVTREGIQQTVATRLTSAAGTGGGRATRLTGHARWDPVRNLPLPAATNVSLEPGGRPDSPWAGDRCVVADVRSLGMAEYRSSGRLALRLLAVRAADGVPLHPYVPLVVQGEAADFLTAITGVGETVSYFPGPFSVGGAELSMDLSRLRSKSEV